MINELDGLEIQCAPPQLVPYGQGYDAGANAGCAFVGAQAGSTQLTGQAWANNALRFYKSHVWRNFGIVCALCKSHLDSVQSLNRHDRGRS